MKRKITVPHLQRNRLVKKDRSRHQQHRPPTPVRAEAVIDQSRQYPKPTLLLRRRFPSGQWIIPPVTVPLYWFDRMMIDKGWILPIPPDTFVVDGRRFKALAQDQNYVGRFAYTRWLVYEEAAVPKGEKP